MWELAARVLLSAVLVVISGWLGVPAFAAAWKIAALTSAYAFLFYVLDSRKLMNPGLAGLGAGLDALAIGAAVGCAGELERLGFLVLGPIVYAVARRGSYPAATGAIGAASVFFADGLTGGGGSMPSPAVLAQAGGVLVIALLANQPRIVVRPKSIKEMIAELGEPDTDTGAQVLIELRDKYRRLSTSFKELERRSRVDRVSARLLLARREPGDYGRIVERLRQLLEVDGAILYTVNQVGDRMLVAASSGRVPAEAAALSFHVTGREAAHQITQRTKEALAALVQPARSADESTCNVLLRSHGRVVGVLVLFAENTNRLDAVRAQAEEAAEAVAQIVMDERETRRLLRRLREAELLYELACRLDGAGTESDLGRRTAGALAEIMQCDRIGVWLLDHGRPILLGRRGKPDRLFDGLRFDPPGLEGWLKEGAPPVAAYVLSESSDVEHAAAARERTSSYLLVPVRAGDAVIAFLSAAASAPGALGPDDFQTLRDTAAELAHALTAIRARAAGEHSASTGLLSVAEFQREVLELPGKQACVAHIEPLHFEQLEEHVGRPAIELAARQLGLLIRRYAPRDARACRKADGSYVVLLPGMSLEDAEKWANQLAAQAAIRSIETTDGQRTIPLALRARAADLSAKPEETARKKLEVP